MPGPPPTRPPRLVRVRWLLRAARPRLPRLALAGMVFAAAGATFFPAVVWVPFFLAIPFALFPFVAAAVALDRRLRQLALGFFFAVFVMVLLWTLLPWWLDGQSVLDDVSRSGS
jgi:hypothetical protein